VQGNNNSYEPSISADGRYVAFRSNASNLVADDTNGTYDVFVKDLQTGAITRASTDASGTQGNSASFYGSISAELQATPSSLRPRRACQHRVA